MEANSDAPEFLIGGTPDDWKLNMLPPVVDEAGVVLNKPPVFGCVVVEPNNPVVVGLLALLNNPLPVVPVLLENNPLPKVPLFVNKPLPFCGVVIELLVNKLPENKPLPKVGFAWSFTVSTLLYPV